MGYDAEIGQEILGGCECPLARGGEREGDGLGGAGAGPSAASGRLDLYIHLALYPWDLASGILLVSEAGGVVTELDGQPVGIQSKSIIATNRDIHRDFMGRSRG